MSEPTSSRPYFTLDVGKSVRLRDIHYLAKSLDQSVNATTRLLRSLHVPLFVIKNHRLYNEVTFEAALFATTTFEGPGLAAPASIAVRHRAATGLPTKLPEGFATGPVAKAARSAQQRATANRTAAEKSVLKSLVGRKP